uniref:Major facilitator superfamily (MFS) profile domain-containing protein n=1 Tax=Oryza nivara TaxID=4536 RepID=A0A0E0I4A7_ORYNI
MGGSEEVAQGSDGARVAVVVVGAPVGDDSAAPPPAAAAGAAPAVTPGEEAAKRESLLAAAAAAAAAAAECKQEAAAAATGLQAMAVTVARDVEAGGLDASTSGAADEKPSWFTPKRLLVMFCLINMLNYVDRGAIASNGVNGSRQSCTGGTCTSGSGIQGDFNLNNFEDGVLSSAFMVGLLIASPIFASLAKIHNPFRLIGVGLLVWTIATAGCGCSFDFWSITICRMLVGVGEASFISLAAPFIDDNAPAAQKTAWLAMFYMCIPTGIAVGYVYGGLVGNSLHWRAAFWGESILMLPFVILGFVIKPLELKGFNHSVKTKEYGEMLNPERQDETKQDIMFGGITIVCGIFGTLSGGFILDKIDSTISNAFKLLSGATFLGAIFCFGAFCFKSLYGFIPFFSVGELLVFATQAPVNYVCLHCVKPSLRPLSMAMSTVAIHIFGDVPSSPLVGLLQDKIHNWRSTALTLTSILFIAAIFWFIGIFVRSVDRFNEQSEHDVPAVERSNLRPLLDENEEARAS